MYKDLEWARYFQIVKEDEIEQLNREAERDTGSYPVFRINEKSKKSTLTLICLSCKIDYYTERIKVIANSKISTFHTTSVEANNQQQFRSKLSKKISAIETETRCLITLIDGCESPTRSNSNPPDEYIIIASDDDDDENETDMDDVIWETDPKSQVLNDISNRSKNNKRSTSDEPELLEFKSKKIRLSPVEVTICQSEITRAQTEAVLNPTNKDLDQNGQVARCLAILDSNFKNDLLKLKSTFKKFVICC